MNDPDFVAGDVGSKLRLRLLQKGTKAPYDLTGCTVVFRVSFNAAAAVDFPASVLPPDTNGTAEYAFQTGELLAGTMRVEAVVSKSGLVLHQLRLSELRVRRGLA